MGARPLPWPGARAEYATVAAQAAWMFCGFLAMALAPKTDFIAAAWPIDVIDSPLDGISEER